MSLRSTRLNLETLEDRCCPTTVSASNGVLTITGDGTDNTVGIIQKDSTDTLTIVYDVWTPQGQVLLSKSFSSSSIHAINLDLRGGNDVASYTLASDFLYAKSLAGFFGSGNDRFAFLDGGVNLPGGPHIQADLSLQLFMSQFGVNDQDSVDLRFAQIDGARVSVAAFLGGGDDTFTARLNGDLTGTADVEFDVFGQGGMDELRVYGGYTKQLYGQPAVNVPIHIGEQATCDVRLDGGSGDDLVGLYVYAEIDGQLRHHLEGGDGVDIVLPMISKLDGSSGQVVAY